MNSLSRFAPSPTGLIHIGNARSAVLNWAYINNKKGNFILRIDDTDLERSKKEYEEKIKRDLSWLGISWNKSFNQSDRKKIYDQSIEILKKLYNEYTKSFLPKILLSVLFSLLVAASTSAIAWLLDPATVSYTHLTLPTKA